MTSHTYQNERDLVSLDMPGPAPVGSVRPEPKPPVRVQARSGDQNRNRCRGSACSGDRVSVCIPQRAATVRAAHPPCRSVAACAGHGAESVTCVQVSTACTCRGFGSQSGADFPDGPSTQRAVAAAAGGFRGGGGAAEQGSGLRNSRDILHAPTIYPSVRICNSKTGVCLECHP